MNRLPTTEELQAVRERTIHGPLGIEVIEATPERVVLEMPVSPTVHQPYGVLHGGASVVIAESAASIGAWLAAGDGMVALGTDINASHLRTVVDGRVRAVATPIRQGRTIAVWDVQITDAEERLVCVVRCTLAIRSARA
jgi:uncharacterized protein (TIGR00369 family)